MIHHLNQVQLKSVDINVMHDVNVAVVLMLFVCVMKKLDAISFVAWP